jgi:hypothetical protein
MVPFVIEAYESKDDYLIKCHTIYMLDMPQRQPGQCGEEKMSCLYQELNPDSSIVQAVA